MKRYIPTGNEIISLPKINQDTAGIEDFTFLSMHYKGMIEVRGGNEEKPLIQPFIEANGQELPLTNLQWSREHYWLPTLKAKAGSFDLSMTVLPPIEERGLAIKLILSGSENASVRWGLKGCWESNWHCVNEDKPLEGTMHCYESGWNFNLIFDFRSGGPVFAFAPMCTQLCKAEYTTEGSSISYTLSCSEILSSDHASELVFYWGLGFEEVSAATSAKEMLRRGWEWEYKKTTSWLNDRIAQMGTPKLTSIYNTNLFFCIFYSTGTTLDTEELVCATSRSTRYYVSAAYWDRDVLLWAFPAILDADEKLAKEILHYVFGRQRKNIGIHSRYIDGTILEPGFELDELLAPVIALEAYTKKTGDEDILTDANVQKGILHILEILNAMEHPEVSLYETFLQPTDDEIVYPYLTYNNVLVWKSLNALAKLFPIQYGYLSQKADLVKEAIYKYCVFYDEKNHAYFSWSIDLKGNHNIYDEPPGSLQLLPYYGFCEFNNEVWRNTIAIIRSPKYEFSFANSPIAEIGCAHAPYPWILSLCNSLLCGHAEQALQELEIIEMDNGIACESVDPIFGKCTTGAAFATCAGFLCHSMRSKNKEESNEK